MKRIIYSFVSVCLLLSSCSMDETPQASVDKDTVFRTEKGLETYSYSFYNMLPSVSDGFRQDAMCDYGAVTSFDNFIREGAYSAELSSGWSWSDLRNINYFIENCTNEAVDESVRNNYIGLARFFRAYFYYEMVVRFGDVPWIDRTLGVDDELLYAPRDSRTIVMDHVLEDLDFGCEERPKGMPVMAIVTLTNSSGEEIRIKAEDAMLYECNINEGDKVCFDVNNKLEKVALPN